MTESSFKLIFLGKAAAGKTSIIRTIMSMYNFKPVTIVSEANNEAVREAFSKLSLNELQYYF